MIPGFEWDPAKRITNLRKHGIDFVRAIGIFDGFVTRQPVTDQEHGELRIVAVGSVGEVLLTVVYTPRGSLLRIISARRANGREARAYRAVRPPEASGPD